MESALPVQPGIDAAAVCARPAFISVGRPWPQPVILNSPSDGFGAAPSPRLRILIVDDHELVRAGLAALLGRRWDVCGEAANGAEAIQKVRDLKPDLVILDLSMPVMSGTEAAKTIRTLSPQTKIVFLSMHDSPTVVQLVKTIGADGFISKNSPVAEFRAKVAEILEGISKPLSSGTGIDR